MRTNVRSNTDSLEFHPDLAPASDVDIQNLSQTRDNRRPPSVFASDILPRPRVAAHANHVSTVPRNSEKIDLITIMNSFALVEPSKNSRQVESVYAVNGQQHIDHDRLAHVDAGEEKLSTLLAEKYASKKISLYEKRSQSWPSITGVPSTRKRARGIKAEQCVNDLSGLDLQLYQASQSQNCFESTKVSTEVELQHAQSLCEEIKQYKVHVDPSSHALSWEPHHHLHLPPPVYEPLRAPSEAIRQLVSDRLFLLDDHCFEVKRGSAKVNAFNVSSKDRLIKQAAEKIDITGLQQQVSATQLESVKKQSLECALARHTEALVDASLEMAFQHCAQDNRLTKNTISTHENEADAVDSTVAPIKKRKIGGNKVNKEDSTSVHEQLFSWTDVLHSLQKNAEKAAHRHSNRVEVHQDLPSLHLSESVLQRTARRLRALYAGQSDAQLLRAVPSVFDYDKNIVAVVCDNSSGSTQDARGILAKDENKLKHKKKKAVKKIKEEESIATGALSNKLMLPSKLKSKWKESVGGKLKPPAVPVAVWEK